MFTGSYQEYIGGFWEKFAQDQDLLLDPGLLGVMENFYSSGFLAEVTEQQDWIDTNIQGWDHVETILKRLAHGHIQDTYAKMQRSLHQEWHFLYYINLHLVPHFLHSKRPCGSHLFP